MPRCSKSDGCEKVILEIERKYWSIQSFRPPRNPSLLLTKVKLQQPIRQWLKENDIQYDLSYKEELKSFVYDDRYRIKKRPVYKDVAYISFNNEHDAILFKMKW